MSRSSARVSHEVAELVRLVAMRLQLARHRRQGVVVLEQRAQQLVVAGPGLVRAGHDRVCDAQRRSRTDAPRRDAVAGPDPSVRQRRVPSARTTVVPIAITRPATRGIDRAAVAAGIR
jgi:hypothetical protein